MPNKYFLQNLFLIIILSLLATACTSAQKTSTSAFTPTIVTIEIKPTVSSTNTYVSPSVLPKLTQTATSKPSSTPTIVATATEEYHLPTLLMESQYLVVNEHDGNILMIEVSSGKWRTLDLNRIGKPFHVLSFTYSGCALYIEMEDKSIIKVTSKGNDIKIVLPKGWYSANEIPLNLSISPSEEWVAYIVGKGYQDYDSFEKQELHLYELGTAKKVLLSKNDGVWDFEWAPNGQSLAFTDIDANGVGQVFIAKSPDWQTKKVTNFSDPNQRIEDLSWSPQGDRLVLTRKDTFQETILISILQINGNILDLDLEPYSFIYGLWWQGENSIGILAVTQGHTQPDERNIYYVDTKTGNKINLLEEKMTNEGNMISAMALSDTSTGIFSSESFYVYDFPQKSITRAFPRFFDIREWLVSPLNFGGEESCLP